MDICAICDRGFYRNSGVCTPCPEINYGVLSALFILGVVLLHKLAKS